MRAEEKNSVIRRLSHFSHALLHFRFKFYVLSHSFSSPTSFAKEGFFGEANQTTTSQKSGRTLLRQNKINIQSLIAAIYNRIFSSAFQTLNGAGNRLLYRILVPGPFMKSQREVALCA